MGARGPKPLPEAVKRLRGTSRSDRRPAAEMDPEPGAPEMPDHLDEEAKAEWRRIVPQLAKIPGLLAQIDREALTSYVLSVSLGRQATKIYGRNGTKLIVHGPHGPQPNPAIKIAMQARAEARRFAAEFGLTPAARTRVGRPSAPPASPAAPVPGTKGRPPPTDENFLFDPPALEVIDGGKKVKKARR